MRGLAGRQKSGAAAKGQPLAERPDLGGTIGDRGIHRYGGRDRRFGLDQESPTGITRGTGVDSIERLSPLGPAPV